MTNYRLIFFPVLENKLEEELNEYLNSKELEELADLLEVIYRIAELRGSSKAELETMKQRKKQEKGGFEKNLLLLNPFEEDFHPGSRSADSVESKHVVFKPENVEVIEKYRVKVRIYPTKTES